jgi:light-regulated signal transduction histidine kinase (bacteriophytochrome)
VTSYTQLLARKYAGHGDAESDEYTAYVTEAVQRMRDLIEGLLAYSRVTRGEHKPEAADLDRLLDTALANLKTAIDSSGAKISRDALPMLRVSPQQITQLFQNLVGNAIKFRDPAAPPEIHVGARQQDGSWTLSVRDRGIGIDPQHAGRIFALFRRLHTRDTYPGSGLGLAICKKIVEQHGGRIWVEPANPGSVFRFTLPAG